MTPPDDRSRPTRQLAAGPASSPTPSRTPGPRRAGRWRPCGSTGQIFRASLVERMTYRGDFLLGRSSGSCRWSPPSCSGRRSTRARAQSELAGFRYREMIAYLLLTNISRMFSSMPGLAGGIARDIREGTLKRYLIQPIDMIGYLLVVPGRPQGGVHRHVVPALRPALLRLPRLLRRVPRRR